jgi:type II secretory pathway component GspD/PulD (secretin)
VADKVRDLRRRGVLVGVKHVQLSALEGQQAKVKVGESRPFVTGVTAAGARFGGVSRSITYRQVGTVVRVKPEVGAGGLVTLDLQVEDSRMRTPEGGVPLGPDAKGERLVAPEFVTTTLDARLKVRLGHAVLAQGTRTNSKAGEAQVLILVAASGEEAPPRESR